MHEHVIAYYFDLTCYGKSQSIRAAAFEKMLKYQELNFHTILDIYKFKRFQLKLRSHHQ